MKLLMNFLLPAIFLLVAQSCDDKPGEKPIDKFKSVFKIDPARDKNNWWNCPDNIKGFPPLSIKDWRKAPALDRKLPTYEEATNGTSLIFYGSHTYPDARAYDITLPRLASFTNPYNGLKDTVIVIQVVQTDLDTVAGYRYLTGGNGTCDFRLFHFLTDDEVKKAVGQ
ncbi:MAG: hypothetical protein V4677_12630 [Bacteroidota bacterium]